VKIVLIKIYRQVSCPALFTLWSGGVPVIFIPENEVTFAQLLTLVVAARSLTFRVKMKSEILSYRKVIKFPVTVMTVEKY